MPARLTAVPELLGRRRTSPRSCVIADGPGRMPPNQHFIQITIPSGLTYEVLNPAHLPGWASAPFTVSPAYGATWQFRHSVVLLGPSVVARMQLNILIHPGHPEFARITHSPHQPVWGDRVLHRLDRGDARRADRPRHCSVLTVYEVLHADAWSCAA